MEGLSKIGGIFTQGGIGHLRWDDGHSALRNESLTRQGELTFSHHQQGAFDFNTANVNCPMRVCFLLHPWRWINDEGLAAH